MDPSDLVVRGKSLLTQSAQVSRRIDVGQARCFHQYGRFVFICFGTIGVVKEMGVSSCTACHCHLVLCLCYDWLEKGLVRALQLNNFASWKGLGFWLYRCCDLSIETEDWRPQHMLKPRQHRLHVNTLLLWDPSMTIWVHIRKKIVAIAQLWCASLLQKHRFH